MKNKQYLIIFSALLFLLVDLYFSLYFIKNINLLAPLSLSGGKQVDEAVLNLEKKLNQYETDKKIPLQSRVQIKAQNHRGLIPENVYGISSKEVDGQIVYEIIGWVAGASEAEKTLIIYQSSKQTPIKLTASSVIQEVYIDQGDNIKIEQRVFSDIVPGKTRISGLCTDKNCNEVTTVSIIDRADENS